ncbi:MAG TPA: cytochrome c peroxidase [Saprospiraceae bacterium]|nr:cytochrome c peroxidase [Saprospiraceae bacterium]
MKQELILSMLFFTCIAFSGIPFNDPIEIPKHFPKPIYSFSNNPITVEKIELGRALFYDPILSKDSTISCSSCHSQYNAFAHVDHALSHGIRDQIGRRNAPALMNLAWQKLFMWDGAINHLDMQSLFPITHPKEMDENLEHVISKLQQTNIYPKLFFKAYSDTLITGEHTLKAISAFMVSLVSSHSKYDSMILKQALFIQQETKGYKLFKKHCNSCHTEPLFTNLKFENNGLPVDTTLNDFGRISITHQSTDSLKFKVPTLRNIEFTYPYMHDGRFKRLSEVINHYTSGIHNHPTLSKQLQEPIHLSSNDKVDLMAFLLTLTDKRFLFDPRYGYPRDLYLDSH